MGDNCSEHGIREAEIGWDDGYRAEGRENTAQVHTYLTGIGLMERQDIQVQNQIPRLVRTPAEPQVPEL